MVHILTSVLVLCIAGLASRRYVCAISVLSTHGDETNPAINLNCGKRYYEKSFPVDSRLFEHPWLAQLGYERSETIIYIFQGVLVHKQYVLTTVHVAQFEDLGLLKFVRLGEYNTATHRDCIDNSGKNEKCAVAVQDILVEVVIPHPDFNKFKQINNIALVKLRTAAIVDGISVAPICLNQNSLIDSPFLYIASWCGRRDTGLSKIPKQYQMQKIEPDNCKKRMADYTILLSDGMFCVIFGDNHSVPQVDKKTEPNLRGGNGGPVFTVQGDNQIYLIGLLSYGPRYPATLDQAYVITPVAPYLQWVTETIRSDYTKKKFETFSDTERE